MSENVTTTIALEIILPETQTLPDTWNWPNILEVNEDEVKIVPAAAILTKNETAVVLNKLMNPAKPLDAQEKAILSEAVKKMTLGALS